jgi:hypothetical protein
MVIDASRPADFFEKPSPEPGSDESEPGSSFLF